MFYSDEAGFTIEPVNDGQVEISNELWQEMVLGQSQGKVIAQGDSGFPVLTDPQPLTQAQLSLIAEQKRTSLLLEAQQAISIWQTKLMVGRALTDDENTRLNAWMDYVDSVNAVDSSEAPDINWPAKPEA